MKRYYSNEVDSNETLPLPTSNIGDSSESEVEVESLYLPHSIIRGDNNV